MKSPKADTPPAPVPVVLWRPTAQWHLRVLAGVFVAVAVLYFVMDRFLSRLPEPYRLRDIPAEMTPWLKK